MQRVVITTGGTGGHIFPALAVAEELRRRHPDLDILFVGGRHGREREFAEAAGLRFLGLPVRGVMGRGLRAVGALLGLARGVARCWWLMLRFKPQVVVGFGGYAGFAPVLAASVRGVPCALHEQNSYPGSANRLLGRWVDRIFLSFPDSHGFFDPARSEVTGNPVRGALVDLAAARDTARGPGKRLLVLGGSLGARPLNKAVCAALAKLRAAGFEILHQTGEADLDEVRTAYGAAGWTGPQARVEAFIDDMAGAYAWADLVLCRAGATTVAELAVTGRPSVLVPYPHATHDHQLANAQYLEKAGAAVILMQRLLEEVDLAKSLDALFSAPGRLSEMSRAARALGRPRAAAVLADAVEELAASRAARDGGAENRKEG